MKSTHFCLFHLNKLDFSQKDGLGSLLSKGFKCAHWNVQSICNKMEDLTLLLCGSTNSMDFVAITETWLNDSYNDAWTSIPGFNCERRDRNSSQRGGGIVVYLNENFPYSRMLDYESISPHLECIWIELKVPCIDSIKICTAYRSPSLSVSSWTNDFEDMLEVIYHGDSNVIITGDFNIHLLNHESATRKRWLDLLTITYNFTSLVNSPTRITKDSQSIVDHLFVSNPQTVTAVTIPKIGFSDHYPILFSLKKSNTETRGQKTRKYRNFKHFVQEDILEELSELPWITILDIFDEPDDALDFWYTNFTNILNKHHL